MTTATSQNVNHAARPSDALQPPELLQILEHMMLIRRFEERCAQSYQQAKIGGFCHLYIGQEACAVGSISALIPTDPIITAYRDHGHALARGMPPNYCMAEMFGKLTGCAKGKGGSMHMFDAAHHMYGGHAIVGGQAPLGVGLAFAIQYQKLNNVVVCYMGDGALNQGAVHEAMNLAAIWKLPIIFVVENNMYSMGTHIARGTSMAEDLSVKAAAYGMTAAKCDGMDVLNVYDTFKTLADQMRGSTSPVLGHPKDSANTSSGGGPAFVDVQTYRYKGHSMSDPQKYRSKDEVAQYEDQDPIKRFADQLLAHSAATQEQINQIDARCKLLAVESVKFANESPDTPKEEMYTDVYSMPYGPYKLGELPVMLRQKGDEV